MNQLLKTLCDAMDENMHKAMQLVHLPQQVALPAGGFYPSLYVMPDGEIRCKSLVDGGREQGYLSSRDGGLTFKEYYGHGTMGVSCQIPQSGRYLRVESGEDGTFCVYSDESPDDTKPVIRRISDHTYEAQHLPSVLASGRIAVPLYRKTADGYQTAFAYSDHNGEKWSIAELSKIDDFAVIAPDKGMRWQANGTRPCLAQLQDGTLVILVATADDYLWRYTSKDNGETWSEAEPTDLHATYNGATLLRLSNGRLLLLWNNTAPMPEENHRTQHGCSELQTMGLEPSVFTNRDACHCAISEDEGEHWIGQRELYLTKYRNMPDYRYRGTGTGEKGVYDFDAIEVPDGRVLVHLGHNTDCERLIIFDPSYLYDDGRTEDYMDGMYYMSTHSYLRGVAGKEAGTNGAYSYNRVPGPLAMQDPATKMNEYEKREVLHIYRRHDDRLVSEKMGMTQNFPAWEMGEITVEVRIDSCPLRVSLSDHFINPSDPCVEEKSVFSFTFDALDAGKENWCTYKIAYSIPDHKAVVLKVDFPENDKFDNCFKYGAIFSVRQRNDRPAPLGLSYLHFQTCAETEDFAGGYVGVISYQKLDAFPYLDLV